ncbi:hypothetical protein CXR25_14005 [Brevibacterium aurantiacum]|uniref:hypothetical protein n=1 Tax=Brevibacterium aurantiacum TaxID=273384 RepID=UPI000F64E3FA|nr:hypothetical protein [Brevibacterium aurantiacum]AZL13809.1 hypothetical protein CXR25_14005 [Brevibacterium aurantiacum]
MTNSIGYANPAAINFGALTLEKLRTTRDDEAAARRLIEIHAPAEAHEDLCAMLGIEPPRPGRE